MKIYEWIRRLFQRKHLGDLILESERESGSAVEKAVGTKETNWFIKQNNFPSQKKIQF